jgi:hypothetical protein
MAKYLFTYVKNVAITRRTMLRSYRAAANWVRQLFPSVPVLEGYAVKVGDVDEISPDTAARLIGPEGLVQLLQVDLPRPLPTLEQIGRDFARALHGDSIDPSTKVRTYFQRAWEIAPDDHLRRILTYEHMKWEQALRQHPHE